MTTALDDKAQPLSYIQRVRDLFASLEPGPYDMPNLKEMAAQATGLDVKHVTLQTCVQRTLTGSNAWKKKSGRWIKSTPAIVAAPPDDVINSEPVPVFPPATVDQPEPTPRWPAPPHNELGEQLEKLAAKYRDMFTVHQGTVVDIDGIEVSLPYLQNAVPEGFRMEVAIEAGKVVSLGFGYVGAEA